MNVFYSTLTSKGQTTVPAEVRDILQLKSGDKIRYVHRDGEVIIKPKNKRAVDLAGKFHDPERVALSVEDIKSAIGDVVADHVAEKR